MRKQLRVIHARLVRSDVYAGITRPRHHVPGVLSRGNIEKMHLDLIRATHANTIGHHRTIFGQIQGIHRGVLVRTQLARVDQLLVWPMQSRPHINRCLILLRQPFGEEVTISAPRWHADKISLQQFTQLFDDRRSNLHLRKILRRISILRRDERTRLRTARILEPAIRIRDLRRHAWFRVWILIDHRLCFDHRRIR